MKIALFSLLLSQLNPSVSTETFAQMKTLQTVILLFTSTSYLGLSFQVIPPHSVKLSNVPSIHHTRKKGVQPPSAIETTARLKAAVVPTEVFTSLLPPCLGFIKSEYGVSYGYGFATTLSALAILRRISITTKAINSFQLFYYHALALIFYGTRLNLFLFIRSKLSSRIQEINKTIEERALSKGNRFLTRTPFIASNGLLYYGLVAPLLFTSQLVTTATMIPSWMTIIMKSLISVEMLGFGIAAVGDITKTYVKQSEKNENFLVTSGIFKYLRHPNYTGEIIGWTANYLVGVAAAAYYFICKRQQQAITAYMLTNFTLMLLGWTGILFVLLSATTNLEVRQKEKYTTGDSKYSTWINSTWSGWTLSSKPEKKEIEVNDDEVNESDGSGI